MNTNNNRIMLNSIVAIFFLIGIIYISRRNVSVGICLLLILLLMIMNYSTNKSKKIIK